MNDFYKIGQVIEVRGQKLRIRVQIIDKYFASLQR